MQVINFINVCISLSVKLKVCAINNNEKIKDMEEIFFELKDRVIVVTGGTGVVGSAISRYLAEHGARVVILGGNAEDGESLVNEITIFGGNAIFLLTNNFNQELLEENLKDIISEYGTIDSLINIADNDILKNDFEAEDSILDINLDIFRKVVEANLTGTILPIKVFLTKMIENGKGDIINISSITYFGRMTRVAGFSAAKAAINNITSFIAADLSAKFDNKIRVNCIEAGLFLTKENSNIYTNADGTLTEKGKALLGNTPFARFIEPEEICGTIAYLLSQDSKSITGAVVTVDDGFNMFSK